MRIYESFLDDNIESNRVDVRSAGSDLTEGNEFNEEFAWTFSSFNPAVTQSIYDYLHGRVEYLLDNQAKSYSLGVFSSKDETLPGAVFTVGRLDVMNYAVVLMYTPTNRKSVKLPVQVGATLYNAIRNCPYINGDYDDDHYSLWQEQMGKYRLLDDNDFILECCSDVLKGYNTQIGLLSRTFSSSVVNLGYDDLKNELFKLNSRKMLRNSGKKIVVTNSGKWTPVKKIEESVLDDIEKSGQGSSAMKLASEMFRKKVDEAVFKMIEGEIPDIDLQKYTAVWKPEVAYDLRHAVWAAVVTYGPECNLNWIDTSAIVDMSDLFTYGKSVLFNGDISKWDTSNVVYMNEMFAGSKFNGDISKWNVIHVREMFKMFQNSEFNGDISEWDVSNVKIMARMFEDSKFNRDISKWTPVSCWNFKYMFSKSEFSRDLSRWPKPALVKSSINNKVETDNMFYLS